MKAQPTAFAQAGRLLKKGVDGPKRLARPHGPMLERATCWYLPFSLMGIFRWQHWQTGRLFNWGGVAAPAPPDQIMAGRLLKKGADGTKRLARTHGPMWGRATCWSLPISFMGIFRWQHWQIGRLFNWSGAAAPTLPYVIMAGRRLKKGADGTKRLARTLAPPTPPH
jgi:hypothetical protein